MSINFIIRESYNNVYLINLEILNYTIYNNSLLYRTLYNISEYLLVINPFSLLESSNYKVYFILINSSILIILNSIDLLSYK